MKVACIIRRMNVRGGIQRHVLSLAQGLKKRGHDVVIYAFRHAREHSFPELEEGLKIVTLEGKRTTQEFPRGIVLRLLDPLFYLREEYRAARQLAHLIDPATDILNPHDSVCYRVAYFFKREVRDIPSVWTMHDLPTRSFGLARESALGAPPFSSGLRRLLAALFDRYDVARYIRAQDAIVVLDHRDRAWVKEYFGRDADIVRNGVDSVEFSFASRRQSGKRLRILMTGIFFPHRRFEDGIEALALLRGRGYDVTLTIVGAYQDHDPYYQQVRALVDRLRLGDRVKFHGEISEDALREMYRSHDYFLFPNHLQSWGLAVFEAMASGIPVIVSKTAGASDVLMHRENAYLVNPFSPEEIRDAVTELASNVEEYELLSRNGRTFVEKNISWAKTSAAMEKIFRATLKKTAGK